MTSHLDAAVDIPTPTVNVVPGYDDAPNPKPFIKPTVYIIYKGTCACVFIVRCNVII